MIWVINAKPRPHFTPGTDPRYPLYRRLGGPQGRSGQVTKFTPPIGTRPPDRPARSESLYRLSYPCPYGPKWYKLYLFLPRWWRLVATYPKDKTSSIMLSGSGDAESIPSGQVAQRPPALLMRCPPQTSAAARSTAEGLDNTPKQNTPATSQSW